MKRLAMLDAQPLSHLLPVPLTECRELAAAVGGKPCLATYAASIATQNLGIPVGKRSPHVGFALATSDILQQGAAPPAAPAAAPAGEATAEGGSESGGGEEKAAAAEEASSAGAEAGLQQQEQPQQPAAAEPTWRAELRVLLGASAAWREFSGEGGPLPTLLEEQQVREGIEAPACQLPPACNLAWPTWAWPRPSCRALAMEAHPAAAQVLACCLWLQL